MAIFKTAKKAWVAFAISAVLAALSFVQINSYGADKNHTNGLFTVAAIVLGAAAVVFGGIALKLQSKNDSN